MQTNDGKIVYLLPSNMIQTQANDITPSSRQKTQQCLSFSPAASISLGSGLLLLAGNFNLVVASDLGCFSFDFLTAWKADIEALEDVLGEPRDRDDEAGGDGKG